MVITQTPKDSFTQVTQSIKRMPYNQKYDVASSSIAISFYNGPKVSKMPVTIKIDLSLPPNLSSLQSESFKASNNLDFAFLKAICTAQDTPEFSGYNSNALRAEDCQPSPKTRKVFRPLINRKPSDYSTIYTSMKEAQRVTSVSGQTFTVFTLDQQLYRVCVNILWAFPEEFIDFFPRLGGMHQLMSFVGSFGKLMSNSGLEVVISSAFASPHKLLKGKLYPMCVRSTRFVLEELLRPHLTNLSSFDDMMVFLEDVSSKSRTSKLWVDCLIKPVLLVMKYVRAERTGDWLLHLYVTAEMIPYFFAAGHINFARYGVYNLLQMINLPDHVMQRFLEGEHVMRLIDGIFNGIWSDMFIETTYMRFGKSPGGLIGKTLNEEASQKWALSHHVLTKCKSDIFHAIRPSKRNSSTASLHKEEMAWRIKADAEDRGKISRCLETLINPLEPNTHPSDGIVNIYTGKVSKDYVNVDNSILLGKQKMQKFINSLPDGFHETISTTEVKTLACKPKVEKSSSIHFDSDLLFSRALCLNSSGNENWDIQHLLSFPLSENPPALFDEFGEPRFPESKKSVLKTALSTKVSTRGVCYDTTLIDGCAFLWHVPWPEGEPVHKFISLFCKPVVLRLKNSNVYLIFDRYFECSTKSATRQHRAGSCVQAHHLTLSTPLPPRKNTLSSVASKITLISLICEEILNTLVTNPQEKTLLVS